MKITKIILTIGVAALLGFQFYLFYFADCSKVKDFWVITQTPGRCL